ncbi:protein SSUH2 [Caerostris extrusa]|uniref:Protein SSUH2 n=1 Tax=Caerostris extrusa TaxID=172846 RepID=A0AAV4M2W7_CAEEX|nr:protein SSUH2 [Caerostris extrusa]
MDEMKPPSYEESIAGSREKPYGPHVNTAFETDDVTLQSPSAPQVFAAAPPERQPLLCLVTLTDPQLREACQEYVDESCCYGSRFIRDMILTDILNDSAFHYKLESFGEKRESVHRYTGYYGQSIDGIENGPIPDPWDVEVGVPTKFLDHKITTEIPHSAYVKQCHTCHGRKIVTCSSCRGFGKESCSRCRGRGKDRDKKRCSSCGAQAQELAGLLIVTWKNHINDYVSNSDNLPGDLVTQVEGKDLFCEQGIQVIPMTMALDNEINIASSALIREHSVSFPSEQILAQRHKLPSSSHYKS